MNLIKKQMLAYSLSFYGVKNIRFDNQYIEDVFGNLKLYSLGENEVVIHAGSIDRADEDDFDSFIGDLCYCIHNSVTMGYYDPKFIIRRKREKINVKENTKRRISYIRQLSLWNKGAQSYTKENPEGV